MLVLDTHTSISVQQMSNIDPFSMKPKCPQDFHLIICWSVKVPKSLLEICRPKNLPCLWFSKSCLCSWDRCVAPADPDFLSGAGLPSDPGNLSSQPSRLDPRSIREAIPLSLEVMDINRAGPHVQRPASPSAAAKRPARSPLKCQGRLRLAGQALSHVTAGTHYSWQFLSGRKCLYIGRAKDLALTRPMLLNAWGISGKGVRLSPRARFMPEQPAYGSD